MSETIVVKLGGALLDDAEQLAAVATDVATLHVEGHRLVVVHGGGPQATALSRRLAIEPNIVGGRRVTDAQTLEVCKMVYGGKLSIETTAALMKAGVDAIGLSGVSARLIEAVKRPPRIVSGGPEEPVDFGHVGDIVGINATLLNLLLDARHVPVMNSLGADREANVYNINADIAATRVASTLAADHLVLLTGGVPGVLRDATDPSTRIPRLTATEARKAIEDGVIRGGLIPKIEESLAVIETGVGAIHILGSVTPGQIPRAITDPGTVGTALLP